MFLTSRLHLVLWTALVAAAISAGEPPAVSAMVHHHQHMVTRDGLTKDSRWSDRFLRSPGHVWIERVLPATHVHEPEEAGGKHLHGEDWSSAARHLQITADGEIRLEFVQPEDRVIYETETRDWPEVGFDGSWTIASHLLDPASLASLPYASRKSPQPGLRWRERRDGQGFLRVLWSDRFQLPLIIESGNAEGTRTQSTRIEIRPLPADAHMPWTRLGGFRRREYTDLLD